MLKLSVEAKLSARLKAGLIIGSIAFTPAFSAQAQDKSDAKETTDDKAIIEQIIPAAEKRKSAQASTETVTQLNLDLSLRGGANQKQKGLIKLRDISSAPAVDRLRASNTSALLSSINALKGSDSEALYNGTVTFQLPISNSDAGNPKSFEMALTSHVGLSRSLQQSEAFASKYQNPMMEHRYDLGVRLGYWGFRIDASIVRQDSVLSNSYSGVDLGLGYHSNRFETRLSLKAFREGQHLTGLGELDRAIHDIELAAAYRISSNISLSGRLRYTDFSSNSFLEQELGFTSSSVFLGGRVDF